MEGKTVENAHSRRDQVITMDVRSTIKVDDEPVHVDPKLFLQRLVAQE